MTVRAHLKQASLSRILDAAAIRLRAEGLSGAAIAPVMRDAGLTHGAFYSHFANKDELAAAAFRHARNEALVNEALVNEARFDDGAALLALCVGGMTLARAAADPATAERILAACRAAAARLAADDD